MAVIHKTTLIPSKLELLSDWLPHQPWYRGTSRPELVKAGGFRLDDPAGEVGIEFMFVADTSGEEVVVYHVPVGYRSTPLGTHSAHSAHSARDEGLIGTTLHGVLGERWMYDGEIDPVVAEQTRQLVAGRAVPQQQSISETPDETVAVDPAEELLGRTVEIVRVLGEPASSGARPAGRVEATWQLPGGTSGRGPVLVAM